MSQNFEDRLRSELQQLVADAEPPPTLPEVVEARMKGPHTGRPPLVLAVAAAGVLVVILIVVGILATRGGPSRRLVVDAGTTTTLTTNLFETPSSPPATLPQGTSLPIVVPAPSTASTTLPRTPTTIGKPRTTTSTTTPPPANCVPADLQTTTGTDRPSYPLGQTVTITVTVRNIATQTCQIPDPYPGPFAGSTVKVTQNGGLVWAPGSHVYGLPSFPQAKVLPPGGSYVWTTAQWDQKSCAGPCAASGPALAPEGPQVPVGDYQALPNDPQTPPSPASPVTFHVGP